jgi:carboxylate-amine ligase
VELELQLLDQDSLALTGGSEAILAEMPEAYRDAAKPEFHDCCVEINSSVCKDVAQVEQDFIPKLAAMESVARRRGVLLGWAGTHPFSHWRDQAIVANPRYAKLAQRFQETLARQVTFGLHVHVGVPDGDAAVRVCNGIAEYLPVLLALSVNSPFWCGRQTGLHSHRADVLRASPTSGLPPRMRDWTDYARLVKRHISAGLIDSAKELWWDVRPSPEYGTVEVRVCDMPADLASVLGLTALIQCLVVDLGQSSGRQPALDDCVLAIIRQNLWLAGRFGLGAGLIDVHSGLEVPARDVAKQLAERLHEISCDLGCAAQLRLVDAMASAPSGAARQLEIFARTGDLAEVVRRQIVRPASATPRGPEHPGAVGTAMEIMSGQSRSLPTLVTNMSVK